MALLGGMKIAELKPKQEQLLMAMLSEPSFEEAVRKAGIARTTAFRYKKDPVFMDEFRKLKKEMIETTYLPEVKNAYRKLVKEKFPSIRMQAHNIPAQAYMDEKFEDDPELKTLKETYIKAQHDLINSAVAYNKALKSKKNEFANEVLETGYDEIISELNSNTEGASYGGGYVNDRASNYDLQYKFLSVPAEYKRAYNEVMEGK